MPNKKPSYSRRHGRASHHNTARGFTPSSYGKVSKNQIHPGVLLNAHIPYREDSTQSKLRPAIVVEVKGRTYTVAPIYSNPDNHSTCRTEIILNDRRCYLDNRAVDIDLIDVISVSIQPVGDDVLAWVGLAPTVYTPTTHGACPTMQATWAS